VDAEIELVKKCLTLLTQMSDFDSLLPDWPCPIAIRGKLQTARSEEIGRLAVVTLRVHHGKAQHSTAK